MKKIPKNNGCKEIINRIISVVNVFKSEPKEEILSNTKSCRVLKHIENDDTFGIIFPFKCHLSLEENNYFFSEIKDIIGNNLHLGFIEMKSNFKEHDGVSVKERSLFIPNINKINLFNLCVKYELYSFIYKDNTHFVEICTNDFGGLGLIKTDFIEQSFGKNILINTEQTKELFYKIFKGKYRSGWFLFKLKKNYLYEIVPFSFNELAYDKNKIQKLIKLL